MSVRGFTVIVLIAAALPALAQEAANQPNTRAVFGLVWRNQGGAPPSSGKEWDAGGGNYAASIFGGSARAGAVGA